MKITETLRTGVGKLRPATRLTEKQQREKSKEDTVSGSGGSRS